MIRKYINDLTLKQYHRKLLMELIKEYYPKNTDKENKKLLAEIIGLEKLFLPKSFCIWKTKDEKYDRIHIFLLMIILKYSFLTTVAEYKNPDMCMFCSLLRAICNTLFSVLMLSQNGLDHSAQVMQRILIEQYSILVSVIADEEKRESYLKNCEGKDATTSWHQNFTKKKIIMFFKMYLGGSDTEKNTFIEWYEEIVSYYSAFVHNDYANLMCYTLAEISENCLTPNLCGEHVTRYEQVLFSSYKITFMMDLLFKTMMLDKRISVDFLDFIPADKEAGVIFEFMKIINSLGFDIFGKMQEKEYD